MFNLMTKYCDNPDECGYADCPTAFCDRYKKEADKIIAAEPEKHREYHALVLQHAYERGKLDGLLWAAKQIVPDGNPEVALDKIDREVELLVRLATSLSSSPDALPPATDPK